MRNSGETLLGLLLQREGACSLGGGAIWFHIWGEVRGGSRGRARRVAYGLPTPSAMLCAWGMRRTWL